jgi:hypothetical protein
LHIKKVYKETGKYLYDISKIIVGIAVITPIFKGGNYSIVAIASSAIVFIIGAYLLNKGDNYGVSNSRN